ncbi:MAG: hypothetical protein SRB2_01908 [Desulfobacteraceae bacterium Eth-SRB2]|nr:MAG: hypothetical protein SRB2_01908 [Desulfobacteraceae bacterium Eth-SRB2]
MIRLGFHNGKDIAGYRSLKHSEPDNFYDNSGMGFRKKSECTLTRDYPYSF